MPDASGRFKGLSVPAEAWERIFGAKNTEHMQTPASTLRASYEEHLNIIGPDTHSPFIRDFRR